LRSSRDELAVTEAVSLCGWLSGLAMKSDRDVSVRLNEPGNRDMNKKHNDPNRI
jgi:hypothetical protein